MWIIISSTVINKGSDYNQHTNFHVYYRGHENKVTLPTPVISYV